MRSMIDKIEQQQNHEYRDSFRWVLMALIVMLMLSVILIASVIYKAIFPGQIKFYATMTTGQVVPLASLEEPVVTNKYILEWSARATRAALSLDFVNYSKELHDASQYFTPHGWSAFSAALDKSGLLETVQKQKLMMSVVVPQSPIIRFNGVIAGRHIWRVSMPVLVTFGSASEQRQRQMNVLMIISRVSALDTAEGIQITDFEVK